MFKPNISKDEINRLDLYQYDGHIHLIEDEMNLDAVFDEISQHPFVGFDTETKPTFVSGDRNEVALIQIAIPSKVFLFRINKTGLSKELVSFLEDESILKVGVAIHNDAKELQQLAKFKPRGFLELPDVTEKIGIEARGLRGLAALIMNYRISKNAKITNWEAPLLSEKQCIYAATDAWVCLQMYQKLHELGVLGA
jgi:ribonuclease D